MTQSLNLALDKEAHAVDITLRSGPGVVHADFARSRDLTT